MEEKGPSEDIRLGDTEGARYRCQIPSPGPKKPGLGGDGSSRRALGRACPRNATSGTLWCACSIRSTRKGRDLHCSMTLGEATHQAQVPCHAKGRGPDAMDVETGVLAAPSGGASCPSLRSMPRAPRDERGGLKPATAPRAAHPQMAAGEGGLAEIAKRIGTPPGCRRGPSGQSGSRHGASDGGVVIRPAAQSVPICRQPGRDSLSRLGRRARNGEHQ